MKRNTIVLGVTLLILATFAWAGWANWEYRKQAAERALASASHAELVPSVAGDVPQSQTSLVGKPAPDFVLENLSGQTVSLSSFKGKPLLINFWATWCGPCKIETPWLIELQNEYAAKGFEIVGISTEGDDLQPGDKEGWRARRTAIAKFVKEYHMQYPVLVNGDSLATKYGGLDAMPTSVYVNREGKVVAMQLGITSKEDMAANIEKTLGPRQVRLGTIEEQGIDRREESHLYIDSRFWPRCDPALVRLRAQDSLSDTPHRSILKTEAVRVSLSRASDCSCRKASALALHFRIRQNLHINSHTPREEYLIPTVFSIPESSGVRLASATLSGRRRLHAAR